MPTYEFRCPAGHDFEKFFRKISDASAELPCPDCGAVAQRRVSAGAGLLFKGSGFYITDYGKDGKGARKPSDSGSDAASGGDKTKSGDTKPASTGESSTSGSSASPPSSTKDSSTSSGGAGGSGKSSGTSSGKSGGGT